MLRRLTFSLAALVAVACGEAFTTAPDDGGSTSGKDGPVETGVVDASVEDVRSPRDAASSRDAVSEDVVKQDAGPEPADTGTGPVDSGPAGSDAAACLRVCPSGFDCLLGKCVDRAATHFSATNNTPFNWSYGYFVSLGAMFQPDAFRFAATISIDVWTNTMSQTIEPSVFHNSSLLMQSYKGMIIPAEALGLYPGATDQVSVVRWTAPLAGSYAIDATFTGISTPLTTVETGVLVKNVVGPESSEVLNKYGDGNSFTYSGMAQTFAVGDAVDFYVSTVPNSDDQGGGVTLDARITAE